MVPAGAWHRDLAGGEEPSHRLSPQDGAVHAAGGIRRRARANWPRVDDAAQDLLQQDAHVRDEMEARALTVLLAGLSDPDSRPEPAAPARRRQRKARSAGSSAGSCAGSLSWSQSSLQSLVNRYEASRGSSDDQGDRRDSIVRQGSQGSFSSAHSAGTTGSSLVNNCYDDGNRSQSSMQSPLVQRLNQVLTEREVGDNSELERCVESFGIQREEMMILASIVLFPPVAMMAALAAVLCLL